MGYESVKAFAKKGVEVILASRSLKKGDTAKAKMEHLKGKVVVMQQNFV